MSQHEFEEIAKLLSVAERHDLVIALADTMDLIGWLDRDLWGAHFFYEPESDVTFQDLSSTAAEIAERRCMCAAKKNRHTRGCWCGPQPWQKKEQ